MRVTIKRFAAVGLALVAMMLPSTTASAQAAESGAAFSPDKFEVYAGYGYWRWHRSQSADHFYGPAISNPNAILGLTYFLGPHLGIEVQGLYMSDNRTADPAVAGICGLDANRVYRCAGDQRIYTVDAGPVIRGNYGRWTPWIHALGGGIRANGPAINPITTGWEVTAGFGLDYTFKFWNEHLAIRPIQIDGHYGRIDYGPLVLPSQLAGGSPSLKAFHLSGGLVYRLGGSDESVPQEVVCSADPGVVYPGDVVHLSATSHGMGNHLYYSWTAPNLKDGGSGANALDIPTTNLAPGNYEVSVRVSRGARGKVRRTCNTSFQIHNWDPPTIACKAQPESVDAGNSVTIVSDARSPQNRALTVSYTTSAGAISGTGPTVTLATDNVPAGAVQVTCTATDDLGQKAQSTATVTINQPAPPPAPVMPTAVQPMSVTPAPLPVVSSQQTLCSLSFERDRKRPTRVDNEAKACLDSVALSMGRDAQNRLVIVGTYTAGETMNAAAARAIHAKEYLTQEKGVDPNSVDVMLRQSTERAAENVLLPPGATFDEEGAVGFDPTSVHPTGEAYGKRRRR